MFAKYVRYTDHDFYIISPDSKMLLSQSVTDVSFFWLSYHMNWIIQKFLMLLCTFEYPNVLKYLDS